MTTDVLQASYKEISNLDNIIAEAQAHLRVLEDYGKTDTLTLRNTLRTTIADAEKMKGAIQKELSSS